MKIFFGFIFFISWLFLVNNRHLLIGFVQRTNESSYSR